MEPIIKAEPADVLVPLENESAANIPGLANKRKRGVSVRIVHSNDNIILNVINTFNI